MIEALAHDLGNASQARFGDHAAESAEMLRKAGGSSAAFIPELRYRLSRTKVPAIEERPKDLMLRVEVLGILKLKKEGMRSYKMWK